MIFARKLFSGQKVTTIEITPPRSVNLYEMLNKVRECKQAGIDAHIALAASNTIGNISKELPSVQQFDTVLVVIPQQDGKYKWLDPSYRSTFAGELPQELNDSDAMIVNNVGTLTKTPKSVAYKNREEIKGEVKLLADGNADAEGKAF